MMSSIGIGVGTRWGGGAPKPVPLTIPDLSMWLDAADASTFTLNAGSVAAWRDKSGNGRDWSQGVGANQPLYSLAAQNGKNAVDFNGSSHELTGDADASVTAANAPGITLLTVTRYDTIPGTSARALSMTGGGPTLYDYRSSGTPTTSTLAVRRVSTDGGNYPSATVDLGTTEILGYRTDFSEPRCIGYKSASQTTSSTTGLTSGLASTTPMTTVKLGSVGGSLWFDGLVCEILVYKRNITLTEYQALVTYLKAKWGTP